MSQRAHKPSADACSELPDGADETTGRYALGPTRRSETVLPPAGEQTERASLDDAGDMIELEPDAVIELAPMPAPPRGMVSGVFSNRPQPPEPTAAPKLEQDPEIVALASSFEPYYRQQERASERARLDIADLSLLPDNPYAASSLVPPPAKPFPATTVAVAAAALAVLLGAAGLVFVTRGADSAEPGASAAVRTAPARSAPARREAAPRRERPHSMEQRAAGAAQAARAPAPPPRLAAPSERESQPSSPPTETSRAVASQPSTRTVERAGPRARTAEPSPPPAPVAAAPAASAPAASSRAAAAQEPAAALPETPTREQVAAGFQAVRDQLAQCAAGKHGLAEISATIANSGRITHALIEGEFRGTQEGSCMARAVREARFPQFSQPHLKVSYPVAF